jgi:hypothetical protein
MGAECKKIPLFSIKLILNSENKPQYSVDPTDVCLNLLSIFDEGLEGLKSIGSIEMKVMPHLFRTRATKCFHKVPVKPDSLPEVLDKKVLPNENTWLYLEYSRLRTKLLECVEPMDEYLKTFNQFSNDYLLDPDKVLAEINEEDNMAEPEVLKRDVISR